MCYSSGQATLILTGDLPLANEWTSKTHKYHEAGLTAILPLPFTTKDSDLILTGSYDETIRLYSPTSKTVLAKLKIEGGGIYRLKIIRQFHWTPSLASYTVLACCTHAGTKVLQVQNDLEGEWTIEEVAGLSVPGNEVGNYCYAADVRIQGALRRTETRCTETRLCVSATWVDRMLTVWEFRHTVQQ